MPSNIVQEKASHIHKWLTVWTTFEYRYECASGVKCECGEFMDMDDIEEALNNLSIEGNEQ